MYRQIAPRIEQLLQKTISPIILIVGLRQTGKTTLAHLLCQGKKSQLFNFDLVSDRKQFIEQNRHSLADFAKRYTNTILVIDEVQKLPESTSTIKHLFDQYKIKFILTGSSELKIKTGLSDSLVGRVRNYRLYPLSIKEILVQKGELNPSKKPEYDQSHIVLQKYLVYGSLPQLENIDIQDYASFLRDYTDGLLSKDILEIAAVRNSTKVYTLAKLLAMQIGQLVNVNELATLLEMTRTSIYNYLDILEQMNIISRAYPLSTNRRQAIATKFKVYFTDLGVRNVLINNFDPLPTRLDIGALLENAVYLGLKRQLDYQNKIYELGFFRSKTGTEIDMVNNVDHKQYLYEVKASKKYMNKKGAVSYITLDNAWEFLI